MLKYSLLSPLKLRNVFFTRLIEIGSKPIDLFAVVVSVSKLSLELIKIVIDIVDGSPRISITRYICLEKAIIVV